MFRAMKVITLQYMHHVHIEIYDISLYWNRLALKNVHIAHCNVLFNAHQ